MARLNYYLRSRTNWTPASYSIDETAALISCQAGDLVGPAFCLVRVAFDGTGGRTASLGDGDDVDRYITTTNSTITTADTAPQEGTGGTGSTYLAIGRHLYQAADNIDVTFVAATGGGPTVGSIDFWVYVAKIFPR